MRNSIKLNARGLTVFFLLLVCGARVNAQVPSTDIFIADLSVSKEGIYKFSKPLNITNREGYENQPFFAANGKIYYTALVDSSGTDVFVYDPGNGKNTRLTKTQESEYSPTLMPGNKAISVVRVDKDSAQRLYQVSMDGRSSKLLLKNRDSVGYFCWIDNQKLAMYILGDSATLWIGDISTQKAEPVVTHISRCIARIPGTNLVSYVEKLTDREWFVKAWYSDTKKSAFLAKTLEGCEDYTWTPDKKLLMGKEGKLFMCDPFKAQEWKEIADFSTTIGNFYRISLNPDGTKIAFVSYKGNKP